MAFSQSWALRAFSLLPGSKPSIQASARPLQMGSFLPEKPPLRHHTLESSASVERTNSSTSSDGMDLEFDAVLLNAEKGPDMLSPQVLKAGPVSRNTREVREWLEAAVFGEDEDFGALLVEPLQARVALGPIYNDIFGIAQEDRVGTGGQESSTNRSVTEDCAKSFGKQLGWPPEEDQLPGKNMHWPAERTHTDWTSRLEGLAGSGTPLAERIEHDMFETVMGVVQSALQECQGPVVKQDHCVAGNSWAVIAGTMKSSAPDVSPKNLRNVVLSEPRGETIDGPTQSFGNMDTEPGKGFGKAVQAQQGLSVEGCNLFQEWGPVKEERNPRLKAGNWKSHGRRKRSPPPRRLGNFGTGKFCGVCSPALSNRLHKRNEVRRECIAGELGPDLSTW